MLYIYSYIARLYGSTSVVCNGVYLLCELLSIVMTSYCIHLKLPNLTDILVIQEMPKKIFSFVSASIYIIIMDGCFVQTDYKYHG